MTMVKILPTATTTTKMITAVAVMFVWSLLIMVANGFKHGGRGAGIGIQQQQQQQHTSSTTARMAPFFVDSMSSNNNNNSNKDGSSTKPLSSVVASSPTSVTEQTQKEEHSVSISPQHIIKNSNNKRKKKKEYMTAPGPYKFPLIGTLPDFLFRGGVDAMCAMHAALYADYGDVYRLNLGTDHDDFVVCDPAVFETIALRTEGPYPIGAASQVTTFVEYYHDHNLTFASKSLANGPDWKDWRTKTNPDLFVLWETYLPALGKCCAQISKVAYREVTQAQTIDFSDFVSRSAFDMFSTVLYGSSPQTTDSTKATHEDLEFVRAAQNAFDITGYLLTNPLEKIFKSDLYQQFVVSMNTTYRFGADRTKEFALTAIRDKQKQKQEQEQEQADQDKEEEEKHANANMDSIGSDTATTDSNSSSGASASASPSSGCPVSAIKEAVTFSSKQSSMLNKGNLLNRKKRIDTNYLNPSYIERLIHRDQLSVDEISELAAPLLMVSNNIISLFLYIIYIYINYMYMYIYILYIYYNIISCFTTFLIHSFSSASCIHDRICFHTRPVSIQPRISYVGYF